MTLAGIGPQWFTLINSLSLSTLEQDDPLLKKEKAKENKNPKTHRVDDRRHLRQQREEPVRVQHLLHDRPVEGAEPIERDRELRHQREEEHGVADAERAVGDAGGADVAVSIFFVSFRFFVGVFCCYFEERREREREIETV